MKQITIFHSDLPVEIRVQPYAKPHAGKLTRIIWDRATNLGLGAPFAMDRMDDRIVVRELSPENTATAAEAA